jgi:hypothetical protein
VSLEAQVVTTVQMKSRRLDAETIVAFGDLLREREVPPGTPCTVKEHLGQRDQLEAVTLTATIVQVPS